MAGHYGPPDGPSIGVATFGAGPSLGASGSGTPVRSDVRKAPAAKWGGKAARPTAKASGPQVLCPIDDLPVPESSSTGVVTEWLAYGEEHHRDAVARAQHLGGRLVHR